MSLPHEMAGARHAPPREMRPSRWLSILPGLAAGCLPPPSSTPVASSQAQVAVYEAPQPAPEPATGGVIVLVDKRAARPTEVIGILDFHSNATDEEKGFEELRARASAMGADAVLSAEFEHGEGAEPSHLSGIVVRFLDHQ